MLQWFLSFPEFAEFTEILFYLGKTQMKQSNGIFPKRFSLNSANSVTDDKIHKW